MNIQSKAELSGAPKVAGRCWHLAAVLMAMTFAAGLHAQPAEPMDLARVPLIVNASLPPNLLVTLDDSGSMGWGYMPDGTNSTSCTYYDHRVNRIYFNPSVRYDPPLRSDGTPFENASFNAAWIDGFLPALGTRNLATTFGTSTATKSSTTANPNFTWRTSHSPISGVTTSRAFYCARNASNQYQVHYISNMSAADQVNFANWFSYYRTRSLAARSAMATAFARMDPSNRVAWQMLHALPFGNTTITRALDSPSWRTAFFENWLYRAPYNGVTPTRAALMRAGDYLMTSTAAAETNPYWDVRYERELSCRQSFHIMITDGYTNESSLSNPDSIGNADLENATIPADEGRELRGPAARVYWNHVHNAGNLSPRVPNMADIAMHYWGQDLRDDLNDEVPAFIADRSTGRIPGAEADDEIYFNPANNPATWQHMVNYFVTFGVGATLGFSRADDCVTDHNNATAASNNTLCKSARLMRLRLGLDQWPAVNNNAATSIDDTWHAAINSRGDFLSADDPQELVEALAALLDNVSLRRGTTGVAASSIFLRGGEYEYLASYDSGNWTGDVRAQPTGDAPPWPATAAAQIDGRDAGSRRILSWRPGASPSGGSQIDFQWAALSTAQQEALRFSPENGGLDTAVIGSQRLGYLRGERNLEQSAGGPFRNRDSVLGAIIGSSIAYVELPAHGYSARPGFPEGGGAYSDFRNSHRTRAPMLYVGSNSGMLHAIDGRTGNEEWAFVPNAVIQNLSRLTTPSFQFVPTVDGKIAVHDVYFDGQWRTVLVGSLGLGGQAVYAIDITEPSAPQVLWEFSDEHDAQLGYNYGEPAVARLHDGTWVALVPSGYNNQATEDSSTRGLPHARPDPHHSDEGEALFVMDIATGAVLHKFTGFPQVGGLDARGLAPVTVAEYGNNFQASFAVGGDLNGTMWRFDLSETGMGGIRPLFAGSPDRPITAAPRVFPDRGDGMMIVFGTGKFLELSDREINASDPRQALYGVLEGSPAIGPATDADLVAQVLREGSEGYLDLEVTLIGTVEQRGWRLEVGNPDLYAGMLVGERFIQKPVAEFISGTVIATSFVPSDNPCAPQGGNVLYILSAYTGGFAFPGELNDDGTGFLPGDPVFPGGEDGDVGAIFVPGIPGPPNPPDVNTGAGGLGGARVGPNGCFVIGGVETAICVTPRRRGWRELPFQ